MKHLSILLSLFCFAAISCSRHNPERPVTELTHTGCSDRPATTRAGWSAGQLTLQYTNDGLALTHTNGTFNCVLEIYGLTSSFSLEGNVIRYRVFPDTEQSANCICLVDKIQDLLTGLQPGEYILKYNEFLPINFTYRPGLNLTFDLDKYMP